MFPRTVCKREITRDEAEYYIQNERTELLQEFTSRFGRPFAATLVLKPNGRHGFEFQPREARAGGAAGRKKAGAKPRSKKSKRAKTRKPPAKQASQRKTKRKTKRKKGQHARNRKHGKRQPEPPDDHASRVGRYPINPQDQAENYRVDEVVPGIEADQSEVNAVIGLCGEMPIEDGLGAEGVALLFGNQGFRPGYGTRTTAGCTPEPGTG